MYRVSTLEISFYVFPFLVSPSVSFCTRASRREPPFGDVIKSVVARPSLHSVLIILTKESALKAVLDTQRLNKM